MATQVSALSYAYPEHFQKLSANSTEQDAMVAYDKWAVTYEQDSSTAGYNGHKLCLEGFEKVVSKLTKEKEHVKIMDAGAGTGWMGEYLKQQGYTDVDALDISQEMLNIAKEKNVYKKIICAPLSEKKIDEVATGEYDILLSAGTIVYGQVKAAALKEIARMVKPGGFVVFTIRTESYDPKEYGYSDTCSELEQANKWKFVSQEKRVLTENPEDKRYKFCYLMIFQVLKN